MSFKKIIKAKEDEVTDKSKKRLKLLSPLAVKIIKIISDSNPLVGDFTEEERIACYSPIAKKVLEEMRDVNMKQYDSTFLFSLVNQAIENTSDIVFAALNRSLEECDKIVYGKEKRELTTQDIDSILKKVEVK